MNKIMQLSIIILAFSLTGCVPAVVGAGAAAGGYAVAKDKGSVGKYASDSVITSKIKAKYLANVDLKSYNISVMTQNGEVILSGSVPSEAMRKNAIFIAQTTEGVKSVNVTNFKVK